MLVSTTISRPTTAEAVQAEPVSRRQFGEVPLGDVGAGHGPPGQPAGRDEGRADPVAPGRRVADEPAGLGQGVDDAQAGRLADVEGAGQLGQPELLARVREHVVEQRDDPPRWAGSGATRTLTQPRTRSTVWPITLPQRYTYVPPEFGTDQVTVLTQPFADAIVAAEKIVRDAPARAHRAGPRRGARLPRRQHPGRARRRPGATSATSRSSSARPRRTRRSASTTRTRCTSARASATTPSTSSPAAAARPPTSASRSSTATTRRPTCPDSLSAFDDRAIEIDADGRSSCASGRRRADAGPNYFVLGPRACDAARPRGVERLDGHARDASRSSASTASARRRSRPDEATLAKRYASAGKALVQQLKTFLQFPEWFYLKLPVNTMTEPRLTPGGLATQYSSAGHYELADDEALIVTVPASDAPYQGFQLGTMWYVSMDFANHQTSLTADQARHDPDGMLRFVVSERDPGLANWLETHRARARLPADPVAAHVARVHRGRRAAGREGARSTTLPARAAALRPGTGHARPVARADRGPAGRRRRTGCWADGGFSTARSSSSPASGPGSAARSRSSRAKAGADVVLAARTESRLDDGRRRDQAARPPHAQRRHRHQLRGVGAAPRRRDAGRVRPAGRAGQQRLRHPAAGRARRPSTSSRCGPASRRTCSARCG